MDWNQILDYGAILTLIGTGIGAVGLIYAFLRNFKNDIKQHMDKMESRIDILEERMFWLATGKKLEDAILEERIKKESK